MRSNGAGAMLNKLIALLLVACFVFATNAYFGRDLEILLNNDVYNVPKRYVPGSTFSSFYERRGAEFDEVGPLLLLHFPVEELADEIPGFKIRIGNEGKWPETLSIMFWKKKDTSILSNIVRRELQLKDSFESGSISKVEGRSYMKVSQAKTKDWAWYYVDPQLLEEISQGKAVVSPSLFRARCSNASPVTGSSKCNTNRIWNDTVMSIGVSSENIHLYNEIEKFIRSNLEEWKKE
jgi:hypothetical protein